MSAPDAVRAQLNALFQRLADGDRSACEPAYLLLWPRAQGLAQRLLRDQAEAEADDSAQTALLKAFANVSDFDAGRDALAWCMGIVAWECRTHRRRVARKRVVPIDDAPPCPARDPSPEQLWLEADLSRAVTEAVGALEPLDRETLEHTLRGAAPPTASAAAFRKRRQRAMTRLRIAWERIHGT